MSLANWQTARKRGVPQAIAKHGPAFGSLVVAVLAVIVFVATFRGGIERGMDGMVSQEGYGRVLGAIAVVLTREHNQIYGYAVSNCIFQQLTDRGFTADPAISARYGFASGQNLKSATFLDSVLDGIWRDLPSISECTGNFRGLGADDVGYSDFVQGAFYLFGHHIRALYLFYFVLYGGTLLIAVRERQGDYVGQLLILGTTALVFAAFYSADVYEKGLAGSMLNPRLMTILGIVPGMHLLMMGVNRVPASMGRVAAVVFQATLVFFVIHIRATGVWLEMLLGLALMLLVGADLFQHGGNRAPANIGRAFAARWPLAVGVVLVLVGTQAVSFSMDEVYKKDGWLDHHAVWHSIYYSFQFHPEYQKKYAAMHKEVGGDAMPMEGAFAYLERHPEENNPDIWLVPPNPQTGYRGALKYSAMEHLVRLAFFDFMKRDPQFVYETFVLKLKLALRNITQETTYEWTHAGLTGRIAVVLVLFTGGILASRCSERLHNLGKLTAVTAAGAAASLSIPVLTVPYLKGVMMEQIMAAQITALLLFTLIVGWVARWLPGALGQSTRLRPRLTE